jgi:hypothetical protein
MATQLAAKQSLSVLKLLFSAECNSCLAGCRPVLAMAGSGQLDTGALPDLHGRKRRRHDTITDLQGSIDTMRYGRVQLARAVLGCSISQPFAVRGLSTAATAATTPGASAGGAAAADAMSALAGVPASDATAPVAEVAEMLLQATDAAELAAIAAAKAQVVWSTSMLIDVLDNFHWHLGWPWCGLGGSEHAHACRSAQHTR